MANTPKISFLLPIRFFNDKEDSKFLGENIETMIKRRLNEEDLRILKMVTAFTITVRVVSYKPVSVELTAKQAQLLLKKLVPHGKCFEVNYEYSQAREKRMLPIVDFQIFW